MNVPNLNFQRGDILNTYTSKTILKHITTGAEHKKGKKPYSNETHKHIGGTKLHGEQCNYQKQYCRTH